MTIDDAAALIAPAMHRSARRPSAPADLPSRWADLGAGRGTFTRALARLLGNAARVDAVDRDPAAVAALARLPRAPDDARIVAHDVDFADRAAMSALQVPPLDGALLANALHFVAAPRQPATVADLAARLTLGGRLVIVEYEDRAPSRWVPAPVPSARLGALADAVNATSDVRMTSPRHVGARPSAFGGTMYAAYLERSG